MDDYEPIVKEPQFSADRIVWMPFAEAQHWGITDQGGYYCDGSNLVAFGPLKRNRWRTKQ